MKIKQLLSDNEQYLTPGFGFVKSCLKDISELRRRPRLLDYASLVCSFKENFDTAFNLNEPYSYFNNPTWRYVSNDNFCELICDLITTTQTQRLAPVASMESVTAFIADVHGVRFGWILYNDEPDKFFVEKEKYKEYPKALRTAFWGKYTSNHVVLGVTGNSDEEKIYVRDDAIDDGVLTSERALNTVEYIKRFQAIGVGRSILFYGPPGAGKSRLVKSVANILKLKTIRINNIAKISLDTTLNILNVFDPDAIILEDLDNIQTDEVAGLLDKLENFNRRKRIILATANQVTKLDNALVRPERFDRLVNVNHLEKEVVRKLVEEDDELFKIVERFPAAYTIELLHRIKALGRTEALADLQDLTDRIANFESSNYELRSKEGKHDDDDE